MGSKVIQPGGAYISKGLKARGVKLDPDLLVAAAIPFAVVAVMLIVRRAPPRADA